ncbi:hypothetical protein EMIHUDRAFT_46005, partial [Emiliania huxleyi CCMP1516]|uniref:Piwi domain-containing protein n=2 Tax=Emiliania huxleyi TaxID=2903 RepID=A0A0D3JSG0_EMIH1
PKRIIFFRDGVAHNQFEEVTRQEIAQIRRAADAICGEAYKPQLIFIVTQMRTKARFAIQGVAPSKGGGKGGGTVVDRDVTGKDAFDWYMVPHHALQGTARASHYHVLSNDAKLSADKLQRFTFDLCHVYGRATKIVSRPAHVYYAHLAAFNGPFYSSDFRDTAGT